MNKEEFLIKAAKFFGIGTVIWFVLLLFQLFGFFEWLKGL